MTINRARGFSTVTLGAIVGVLIGGKFFDAPEIGVLIGIVVGFVVAACLWER